MAMSFSVLTAAKTTAGSIKRWANTDRIDSEQVLEEAQTLLFQYLRVREMRAEFTDLSMSVGDSSKALQTGFLDAISLHDITNDFHLIPDGFVTEQELIRARVYESGTLVSGTPCKVSIFGEAFQFDCKYDTAATLKLVGFKTPTLLTVTTNETNWLTVRYPHLLRTACLVQAWDFLDNETNYQRELQRLMGLIESTNAQDDHSYRGI